MFLLYSPQQFFFYFDQFQTVRANTHSDHIPHLSDFAGSTPYAFSSLILSILFFPLAILPLPLGFPGGPVVTGLPVMQETQEMPVQF